MLFLFFKRDSLLNELNPLCRILKRIGKSKMSEWSFVSCWWTDGQWTIFIRKTVTRKIFWSASQSFLICSLSVLALSWSIHHVAKPHKWTKLSPSLFVDGRHVKTFFIKTAHKQKMFTRNSHLSSSTSRK